MASRQFDVLPQVEQASLVLDKDTQRVDGGQRCRLSLASDLPPGTYRVEVQLAGRAPSVAYATLYRVTSGQVPQRQVELTDASPRPEQGSMPSGSSTIPTSHFEFEERTEP